MLNIKRLSMIAALLLLIGILGSISTYKFISKPESLTEEIKVTDNDFNDIEIFANDGKIELVPTNEINALIEISGYDLKNNFSATVTDSTLSISYKESSKKFYNFNFSRKSASVKVHIPKKLYDTISVRANNGRLITKELEANEIDLSANDGSIDLQNIHADSLSVNANNGRITADSLTGTTFTLKANDGRITLKNMTTDSVSIVSHNGKIELEEVTGTLSAKANDGSINFATETLDQPIDFSTHNGKIHIQTNQEPVNAEIQAQAKNGSITIFGEKKSHAGFGSEKNKIDLSSNDGRIIVEKQ